MNWERHNINWALVSEPGFLDSLIFRFSIFEIICFGKINLENRVGEYQRQIIKVFWGDPGQNGGF